jgi:hypothetical protein
MNEVLTMDEILERENDWLMQVTAQRLAEERLVEGPHGGKHDKRTAARLWREYEMCINTMSLPVLDSGIRR